MQTTRPLRLHGLARGKGRRRHRLHVTPDHGPSVLVVEEAGRRIEVSVWPAFLRLVLLLVHAWHSDAGCPDGMRGVRRAGRLGDEVLLFAAADKGLPGATVIRYFGELRRRLDKALREQAPDAGLDPIQLVETVPGGYRIAAIDLEIELLPGAELA